MCVNIWFNALNVRGFLRKCPRPKFQSEQQTDPQRPFAKFGFPPEEKTNLNCARDRFTDLTLTQSIQNTEYRILLSKTKELVYCTVFNHSAAIGPKWEGLSAALTLLKDLKTQSPKWCYCHCCVSKSGVRRLPFAHLRFVTKPSDPQIHKISPRWSRAQEVLSSYRSSQDMGQKYMPVHSISLWE